MFDRDWQNMEATDIFLRIIMTVQQQKEQLRPNIPAIILNADPYLIPNHNSNEK
jgi:hypothetical protein